MVLLCLLAAACGGRQRAGAAAGPTRIASVRVDGNASIDEDTLVDGLALEDLRATGQEHEPYLIERDEERLRGFYVRRGFFAVDVRSRVERRGAQVDIVFVVDEGSRARLARVEIEGLPDDPDLPREALRALIPLDDGDPFVYEVYDGAKPALVAALERVGYAHARLAATVTGDPVRGEAIIWLRFEAGPLARFGPVSLRGVDGGLADAARARLAVREGDRYSSSVLAVSQAALVDMGRFASVRVEPDRSERAAIVPIAITVAAAPRHELRLGAGLGVNPAFYEARGVAGYSVAGWPWALTTSRVALRPAYTLLRDRDALEPQIEASASLERLDLFRPMLRAEVEAAFSYLTIEAYTSVGPRLRLGLRSPLFDRTLGVSAGWQLRLLRFDRIDEALDAATRERLGLAGEETYRLGFFEQTVYVDLRDDPVSPRVGLFGELRLEEGTRAAAGAFEYVRLTPELRGYVPLGETVLAARARAGAVLGKLPVTQRFFAGGASSQRGFPERTLAPTASQVVAGETLTAPYGGGALLEVGAELRRPLGTLWGLRLGGVAFLDGADVGERLEDLDAGNLHWATGLGVRIATPIGPVRLDVGYRLDRVGAGELRPDERMAYHLSVGEAF